MVESLILWSVLILVIIKLLIIKLMIIIKAKDKKIKLYRNMVYNYCDKLEDIQREVHVVDGNWDYYYQIDNTIANLRTELYTLRIKK